MSTNLVEAVSNSPDNLIAGDLQLVAVAITVKAGQGELPRGQLLGQITGDDYIKCISTANDGSQAGACILAEDIDATTVDVETVGYFSGEFNENAVLYGGADTAATHRAALLAKKIVLRGSVEVA